MEQSKRTSVMLWSSVAAAAAGIAAVAVISILNERRKDHQSVATQIRDVQEVLTDCYDKIREIEKHLPAVAESSAVAVAPRSFSNGNPVSG